MSDNFSSKRQSRKATNRPKKPYPGFPLYAHPLGYWSKKIRGKVHHFGRWGRVVDKKLTLIREDGCWQEALAIFKAQVDDLRAGRTPREKLSEGLTLKALGDKFLSAKFMKVQSGELGLRMFEDYRQICQLLADTFGKDKLVDDLAPEDFEKLRSLMAERWGPVRLGNGITRVKSLFRYAMESGLLKKPMLYGPEFKKPGKAVLRKHRARNGKKLLEANELRDLLDAAPTTVKAMILLGVNCGFGNFDCASLPLSAINLDKGWVVFPRPKTGVDRRCPLWPETVAILKDALRERPEPKEETGLVFINSRGLAFVRTTEKSRTDTIGPIFEALLKKLGLHRDGLGFYSLRHTFRTVGDASKDRAALDLIMGHTDDSMASHYVEGIDDSRLLAVAAIVREWLFGKPGSRERLEADCKYGEVASIEPLEGSRSRKSETRKVGSTRPTLRLFAG
jgi:integrase